MKIAISFFITLIIMASLSALPACAAVTEDEGIISLLKELEIMQGNEYGDMMLDKKVSRAEFAKIAIAASPEKNSVAVGLKQSPYRDVPYTTWYAPYIKAAVSAGYVVGYLDATFRPENTVTYEEAATILLRVLGYDDSTFTDAYPYGQISKANDLLMFDELNASLGDELTRRQVMRMVYNSLKATTSTSKKLIASHDCTITENVDVIAIEKQQNNLGADELLTSSGTFKTSEGFNENSVGMTGTIYVKNETDVIAFIPDMDNSYIDYEEYFVYSVLSNYTIIGYIDGKFEKIDIPQNGTFYQDYYGTTYSDDYQNGDTTKAPLATRLYMGDILYVKRKDNGAIDYFTYSHHELTGPLKVTSDNWISQIGANNSSKVFRNGSEKGVSAVRNDEIVYYSEPIDVVFVYNEKVTGVYQDATPNIDTPKSVVVSSKTYEIESADAFYDLSSSGKYKYGDTVTLLLGKEGKVAGVADTGKNSITPAELNAGYVIESGKKEFTNYSNDTYTGYYAKLILTNGSEAVYETNTEYKSLVCSAVTVTFKDGKAILNKIKGGSVSGKVNASKGMIGGEYVADNIKILDTVGSDQNDNPLYCKTYLQRIDGVTLSGTQVLYSSKNSNGEIDELILHDVTGDQYTYGIVTKSSKAGIETEKLTNPIDGKPVGVTSASYSGSYTAIIDGETMTYNTNLSMNASGPYRLLIQNYAVIKATALPSYSGYISDLSYSEAVIGSYSYLLADNVVVYLRDSQFNFMKIPIEQAISSGYKMTAYYDKAQSSGGRIRIIICTDK